MVAPPPLRRLTVAAAVARYLESVQRAVRGHSLSPATAANYTRDLAEFVELAGADRILDEVTAEEVDTLVLAYGDRPDGRFRDRPGRPAGAVKTRGVGAQARFRQSVSRLFAEAVREGWVQHDPMPRTRVRPQLGGVSNLARKALPEAAAVALLAVPGGGGASRRDMHLARRDEFLLRLLMEAGPRVSEVCRADQGDLEARDDGSTWLRLLGKGRKQRWVPLSEGTVAAYRRYVEEERPAPQPRWRRDPASGERWLAAPVEDAERALVLTWRGLRMTPRDVQLMVARACRRLPAPVRRDVTPHGLRHTAATLLLTSGAADVHTVKELLGHASIATTGVYLDAVDQEMRRAVQMHPVTGAGRRVSAR